MTRATMRASTIAEPIAQPEITTPQPTARDQVAAQRRRCPPQSRVQRRPA